MKASVIISSYSIDRLPDVVKAMDSVLQQTYTDKEIILVIDKDKPELLQQVREAAPEGVEIAVSTQSHGLSAARNAGIQAAKGDIVVFLDDDAVADVDWLERLMENFQDPKVIAAGGRAVPLWAGKKPAWLPEELYWTVGCTYKGYADGKRTTVRNVHGNTMSFRREIFNRIGEFQTNIGSMYGRSIGGEETEFCLRITSGIPYAKIIYDPSAVISHKVPAKRCSLWYLFKRSYGEGEGKTIISYLNRRSGPIKVEMSYLNYLLLDFIPKSLRKLFSREFCRVSGQLLAVGTTLAGAALGYFMTRLKIIFNKAAYLPTKEIR